MRHYYKRTISFVLCLILLFAVSGVSALAESKAINSADYTALTYKNYVSVGDSVVWGYGLQPEEVDPNSAETVGMRLEGTYTDIIGKVLEENNNAEVNLLARSGTRLSDMRTVLELGLGYENPYYQTGDEYGNRSSIVERRDAFFDMNDEFIMWLEDADLVTFQCGINDIVATVINTVCASGLIDMGVLDAEGIEGKLQYMATKLAGVKYDESIAVNMETFLFEKLAEISDNAETVMAEMVEATNKDADIIIVGYYDALSAFTVIPETDSLLFKLLNLAVASLNDCYSAIADKYDNVYLMVPSDVEMFYAKGTPFTEVLSDVGSLLRKVHPNAAGHEYIAEYILSELAELHVCSHEHVKVLSQTVRKGLKFGVVEVKVCEDCGEILSYGQIATPFGSYDIPEQTVMSVAKSLAASVNSVSSKLLGTLSSIFGKG